MSFCEIKTPPEFSSEIEKWDRDTLADGEKMGNVIEELLNNTVYNNVGISRMNNEIELTPQHPAGVHPPHIPRLLMSLALRRQIRCR